MSRLNTSAATVKRCSRLYIHSWSRSALGGSSPTSLPAVFNIAIGSASPTGLYNGCPITNGRFSGAITMGYGCFCRGRYSLVTVEVTGIFSVWGTQFGSVTIDPLHPRQYAVSNCDRPIRFKCSDRILDTAGERTIIRNSARADATVGCWQAVTSCMPNRSTVHRGGCRPRAPARWRRARRWGILSGPVGVHMFPNQSSQRMFQPLPAYAAPAANTFRLTREIAPWAI